MSTHIEPTVGRIVLVHVSGHEQPLAALITAVHQTGINLAAFSARGNVLPLHSVHLVQDGETPPTGAPHWAEWMPCQKAQAAKTEQLEQQLAGSNEAQVRGDAVSVLSSSVQLAPNGEPALTPLNI